MSHAEIQSPASNKCPRYHVEVPQEIGHDSDMTAKPIDEWAHEGQRYYIMEWQRDGDESENHPLTDNGKPNCMWSSNGRQGVQRREEYDDENCDNLICTMRGNTWEALPYPIVADSGASASTLPQGWCNHLNFRETEEPKSG